MKRNLFFILFALSIFHFAFRIYAYRESFFSKFDPEYWKQRYLHSQWVVQPDCNTDPHINPNTCQWDDAWFVAHPNQTHISPKAEPIGDDGLYAYVGWEYIHGKDPTLLNAEIPPFGKYLIGISEIVFHNQNIFALLCGIIFLFSFFLLNTKMFKSRRLALVPVALFAFEPLFYTQLRAPFLDLLYGTFLFLTFYFFLSKKYFWSMVFLGCMMATKAPIATLVIVAGSIFLYLLIIKKYHEIKKLLFFTPVALLFFIASYTQYFLQGHTIIGFLKVQKWIISFYGTGAKGTFGDIFDMILTGKWSTWFSTHSVPIMEWSISWPVVFLLTLFCIYKIIKKKNFNNVGLFMVWTFAYLLFLCFIPVFPRYLLLLLPFMYNLSVWVISKNILSGFPFL